ncbi:aBC transporter permease [Firmicutes bacterium CAG:631]|mgnify:FL=1|nr:aBC transporter permease [Firmicutes bacterium CAG:631]
MTKETKSMAKPNRGPHMGGGRVVEKPKNFKKSMKELIGYVKPFWWLIVVALLFAIVATICNIISPKKLGDLSQNIFTGLALNGKVDLSSLTNIGITLIIIYVLAIVFEYAKSWIMTGVTQKITYRFRKDISEKINKVPLSYFDTQSYGDVLSRVTNDVDTISQTLNQSIIQLFTSITMFLGVLIMMFTISYKVALISLLIIPLSLIGLLLIVKFSQKYFKKQQVNLGKLNGYVEEMYSGHVIIKAYNKEEATLKDFGKINKELHDSSWKSQFLSGLMNPVMNFIGNLAYVVICVFTASLILKGEIGFGAITSFVIYIRLFTQPLNQIAQVSNNLQSTAAASERVFEFLSAEEMEDESHFVKKLEHVQGKVEFKNVSFGYEPNQIIIKNFSALVQPGQKVAIVGPTGAGKTTIVNLLMKFYNVTSGDILIDDVSIKQLTRENVHDIFGMVLQDTWLFEGSVKENLAYGKSNISMEKIKEACQAAHIQHFIESMSHGYDTILDEDSNISQGQKQLFTIARAMIEDAPMLILDEATSSVDTRTEELIQDAMDRLTKGRTTFVIAHRLSTIKNADMILVMKDGDIIEKGTHDELMALKGFYCNLYNSQFETFDEKSQS